MSGRSGWRRLLERLLPGDPRKETDAELEFHLEMRAEDYRRSGMDEDEARQAARRRMGDLDGVREECARVDLRAGWARRRREWMGQLAQDLRYASRTLRRSPTFSLMAILTLTVGIGATTAIYSLVHAVLLAPLPYAQPDRLVRIWETSPQGAERNVVSPGNVRDWQDRARSFSVLGAHTGTYGMTLTGLGEAERVTVVDVQPAVMTALGTPPLLGRTLVEGDGVEADVALLGHGFWQSRFAGREDAVGARIVLNDVPYTVVGVLPPGFAYPSADAQVWTPLPDARLDPTERTSHNFNVLGLLAPGVSVEQAQAEMSALAAAIAREHPGPMTGWGARVVSLHRDLTRNVRTLFVVLLGGAGVVLLIVCVNLAGLLLARALTRSRELAVRGALGAGRGRLFRQLLTESGLLAVLGGVGGLVLAPVLLGILVRTAPASVPLLERAGLDGRVLAFTAVASLGCALLFGLVPAARNAGLAVAPALRGGRGGSPGGQTRLRSALLVAQVALAVVLLVGAGLFVRSFQALNATDPGFEPGGVLLVDLDLPMARYPEIGTQVELYRRLVERVSALRGVEGVTTTAQAPGSGTNMTFSFAIEGREPSNPSGREDDEPLHAVGPDYFQVLGQRVVEGRTFDARDFEEGSPVVILNESLARKHWPEGGAVGHRMAFRVGETPWMEIVGVVEDVRLASPDVAPEPSIYIPFAQKSWSWLTWSTLVVRAEPGVDPQALVPGVRQALSEVDPALPPQGIRTVEEAFRRNTADRAFAMTLVSGFGLLALLLSVVGLYGLVTYSVEQQRREIGVRIALGAQRTGVARWVLGRSLGLALTGAALGLLGAVALSRLLESLIYGVTALDPVTYGATVALVVAVAVGTAALPAVRAARTDPLRALRTE